MIAFIAISLTNITQPQHVIPVKSVTTLHNQPASTTQIVNNTTKKPRKFTQKTSITRRSTLKKACLYTVYTIAALVGTAAIISFVGFAALGFYVVCILKLPFILY